MHQIGKNITIKIFIHIHLDEKKLNVENKVAL